MRGGSVWHRRPTKKKRTKRTLPDSGAKSAHSTATAQPWHSHSTVTAQSQHCHSHSIEQVKCQMAQCQHTVSDSRSRIAQHWKKSRSRTTHTTTSPPPPPPPRPTKTPTTTAINQSAPPTAPTPTNTKTAMNLVCSLSRHKNHENNNGRHEARVLRLQNLTPCRSRLGVGLRLGLWGWGWGLSQGERWQDGTG